jgi:hypothetical protein
MIEIPWKNFVGHLKVGFFLRDLWVLILFLTGLLKFVAFCCLYLVNGYV